MKEWYGADMGGYQLNPNYKIFGVAFSKQVNGLFYPNLSVLVTVNKEGQIVDAGPAPMPDSSFDYELPAFEQTSFPDPEKAGSKEQGVKAVAAQMTLAYWADKKLITYEPMLCGRRIPKRRPRSA
ncbi:hypothetical protein [Brevibacillus borstelensis]|uniref:hypothetical protein n=1 Tax=Brevibacillus borstelensis TaxID=45462 RepID=UPI0030C40CDF